MTVAEHLPGHTLNFRHIFLAEEWCWPEVVGGEKWCWPEVVGSMATPAVQKIAQERPDVAVEVLPLGTRTEPDGINCKRVRVHLDLYGYVSEVPVIG